MAEKIPYQLPAIEFLESTMAAKEALEEMHENYTDLGTKHPGIDPLEELAVQYDKIGGQLCEAYRNINNITKALKMAFPAAQA